MTVAIEFISIVVKKSAVQEKWGGGISAYKRWKGPFNGSVYDEDDYLLKEGTMSPLEAQDICSEYEAFGLQGRSIDGTSWVDFCVIDELKGPTLKCDWIVYDYNRGLARHIDDQTFI